MFSSQCYLLKIFMIEQTTVFSFQDIFFFHLIGGKIHIIPSGNLENIVVVIVIIDYF